jgi:primary-amine oxidase
VQNGSTSWQPLEYPYTRKTGGSIRNLDADDETHQAWIYNISATISDITMDLWVSFVRIAKVRADVLTKV